MKVLVVGRGGREHALAWRLKQSASTTAVMCAPGNPGTAEDAKNVAIVENDHREIAYFCGKEKIDLVVVGPEAPLVAGLTDALQRADIDVFGPTQAAARLEGSKVYCKQVMKKAGIPTAEARAYTEIDLVAEYLEALRGPCVVKADGLAAGKGVIVCNDAAETLAAAERMLVRREFGDAGATILLEERLQGREVSVLAISDGARITVLDPCQDHKRAFDGDQGPNTGGMGAFCPTDSMPPESARFVEERILVPLVHQMRKEGTPFRGVLYAGLMLTRKGPQVLEFNVRFGDPECQPLMMRLRGDLARTLKSAARGSLIGEPLTFDPRPAVCVVMASGGYPGSFKRGAVIRGLNDLPADGDLKVFHSGTSQDGDRIVTSGGRVLGVTAIGDDMAAARAKAYAAVENITFAGAMYRKDIATEPLAVPDPAATSA